MREHSALIASQRLMLFQAYRLSSSTRIFNINEALQIKLYGRQLKESRKFQTSEYKIGILSRGLRSLIPYSCRLADHDIGLIAPYHAQCLKLRTALRPVADGIKVGSVEEFQGQVPLPLHFALSPPLFKYLFRSEK